MFKSFVHSSDKIKQLREKNLIKRFCVGIFHIELLVFFSIFKILYEEFNLKFQYNSFMCINIFQGFCFTLQYIAAE